MHWTSQWRYLILIATLVLCAVVTFAQPPMPQWQDYHRMADTRTFGGVPNALNVLSNLPFAIVGVLGLTEILGRRRRSVVIFNDASERWPYAAFFAGTTLTAIGSSYYHLAPDNSRLVWDRLPMTVAFMGLLAAMLAERIGVRTGRRLLVPLVLAGLASVWYWHWTELRGMGDLRLYALVQFGSLLLVLLLLMLYPPSYRGTSYLVAGLVAYGASKILEAADYQIFALGGIVSGHTLKHLAAAAGAAFVVAMLQRRTYDSPNVAQDAGGRRDRALAGAGGAPSDHRRD